MKNIIRTLSLLFITCSLSAQTEIIYEEDFLNKDFINETFKGGNEGYIKFFEEQLDYPKRSYQDQIEGLLLFSFTVNTESDVIETTFYTKLDKHIEEQVRSVVQSSRSMWQFGEKGTYTFYQPIVYSMLPYYPHTLEGNLPELPFDLPLKYLQLFVLVKSNRIPQYIDVNNIPENEASERLKTIYTRTETAYYKAIEANRTDIAYQLLNKLIRYNPLKKDFLLNRIALEKQVQTNEYQVYDSKLLSDFVADYVPPQGKETTSAGFRPTTTNKAINPNMLTGKTPINVVYDSIYKEGSFVFSGDFARYFQIPSLNYLNQTAGVMLVELKANEHGEITTEILTYFDSPLEEGMNNFLKYIALKWKSVPPDFYKVQPFYFSKEDMLHKSLNVLIPDFEVLANPMFLQPTEVTGMVTAPVYDSDLPKLSNESKESLKTESPLYQEYLSALENLSNQMEKGKDKKILKALNDVIQLNPFNIDLLEKRINLMGNKAFHGDRKLLAILKEHNNKKP